ncbi:MAG: oxidoreductase [Actinomycetota bacterium]|nr:oxidoreductase [Actinomycetota bacterium]
MSDRARIAVFKMASCDGCQLQLLDAEDSLLDLADAADIVQFTEASSSPDRGPWDVTIVEGSISTEDQVREIRDIREKSRFLMTIGACATSGGVQALRNTLSFGKVVATVYPTPAYIESLATSRPISSIVNVDLELSGCPVDRGELLGAISSLLAGATPRKSTSPVCLECKRQGNVCVIVAKGEPCLGPVTRTGCGALCPTFDRGCYGCFGPSQAPNTQSLTGLFQDLGLDRDQVASRYQFITNGAPAFRAAAQAAADGNTRDP